MSLDGAFLHIVKNELIEKGLIGGRVDKIYQPSREEIVLSIRTGSGNEKLMFSANPISARVSVTALSFENPMSPPMFCMLLRKHLGGGKLIDIKQDGLERILDFYFECMNEIGDMVTNRLTIEIMGRSSNIMLLTSKGEQDENGLVWRVVDSIKRVTDEISSVRRVLPNIIYELPPRAERLSLLDFGETELRKALEERKNERLSKAITAIFEGIAPIFARECAYYTAHDIDVTVDAVDKEKFERLMFFLTRAGNYVKGKGKPVIITEKANGKPIDFSFINIEQYGNEAVVTEAESANALLDKYFNSKAAVERIKQRSGDLLKMLLNTYERISRKLETQKMELQECNNRDRFRVWGDIINSNLHLMQKGMTELEALNFYSGEMEKIRLDIRLTPVQNAQKYYQEYKKLDTAEKMLTKFIAEGEEELKYIDSVFDAASRMATETELAEIKAELVETGYIKNRGKAKNEKKPKAQPPMHFKASDGTDIYVGKNNKQNDLLTLKTSSPNDMWLHTQGIAGSHVIIKNNGQEPKEETLYEAAVLAAFCSKGRNSSRVPVDYTLVKYVKKPQGAKPGMVIFTNNKTLFVTPDEEIYNKLLNKKG